MEITARVELYIGKTRESVQISLTPSELEKIFEERALDAYHCDSAKTQAIEFKTTV